MISMETEPTKMLTFENTLALGPELDIVYDENVVKNEKMLFSADCKFSYENGGPLTRKFVDELKSTYGHEDWIIDSRVHMLMKGWYPCIPGWHHDDVPRSTPNSQPNYRNPEYLSEHVMLLVGDASRTEYLTDPIVTLPEVTEGITYGVWDLLINEEISMGNLHCARVKPNQMVSFTWQDFHRGTMAVKPGWRMFIRASRKTNRKFANEIRQQVQVYVPGSGW